MKGLEQLLTEENLKTCGAKAMLEMLIPPIKEMQNRVADLEEELRIANIRNEEQSKVIDAIVKSLKA